MEISHEEKQRQAQDEEALTGVEHKKKSWLKRRWIWLILIGALVAIVGIVSVIMRSGSETRTGGDGAVSSRTASDHSPGSEVILYVEGRSSVMVAVDENALDELINAISSRGDEVQTLIQSGRVLTVPNKTRVRIIEADFAKLKVRIIEGDKIMSEVWVPERWVR